MFHYNLLSAHTIKETLDCLSQGKSVQVLAGGTDLLVNLHKANSRLESFETLLDISHISELNFIKKNEDSIEIGPLVTHSTLASASCIRHHFSFLAQAAQTIGSTQIRNRGTIGGNIVNASPAADLLPPLIALKSKVECSSKKRKRVLPLEEFLTGPYQTRLLLDELLTKIIIPLPGEHYYAYFQKIGRRKAMSISRLSLALMVKIDLRGVFRDTRMVPGSATPYPRSFPETEKAINDKSIDRIAVEEVCKKAVHEMVSIAGERWSTPYKKPTLAILLKRALEGMIQEVKENE